MAKPDRDPGTLAVGSPAVWSDLHSRLRVGKIGVGARATGHASSRTGHWLGVASVLVLALGLRLFGAIAFEQNAWRVGACDEYSVHQISTILSTGNPLRVDVFYYPPLPAIVTATLAAAGNAIGLGGAVPTQCRLVSLLVSVATAGVVYLIGRFWGRRHGLIAMALYAVAMLAVTVSNPPQVYSTLFVALALYFVLRAGRTATATAVALAGTCLGMGVASKYTPLFFAGILFVPYVLRPRSGWDGDPGATQAASPSSGTAMARLWSGGLWATFGVALAVVVLGLVGQQTVYSLLRHLYDQRPHENPFEYHLGSVARLYRVGIAAVGLVSIVAGFALLLPWLGHRSPWSWAKAFYARHRLWALPCAALAGTVLLGVVVPAVLNLHDFARDFSYIANSRGRGDAGFFPQHRSGPSYLWAYFPESLGVPLFAAGLIGMAYCLIRRDARALLLLAGALPAYVLLELSRVKVGRYALELVPLWCLVAAIWLGDLLGVERRRWRWAGLAVVAGILAYSSLYSLAWAEFYSPRASAQTRAGLWLNRTVPGGASLGAKSPLLVSGSPELLPDARYLAKYRLADYKDNPQYVLLPNSVRAIVQQYLEGVSKGYMYTAADWDVYRPSAEDLAVLSRIVREEGYLPLEDFRKYPSVFGFEVASDSLTGRTWTIEHNAGSGLRVYRRAGD